MTEQTLKATSLSSSAIGPRGRLHLAAQLGFAGMTALGASLELLLELGLVGLPPEVRVVLTRLHGSGVDVWVVVSNALALPLALTLGVAILHHAVRGKGASLAAWSALGLVALLALGQLVMVAFVYGKMPTAAAVPAAIGTTGSLIFALFIWRSWRANSGRGRLFK